MRNSRPFKCKQKIWVQKNNAALFSAIWKRNEQASSIRANISHYPRPESSSRYRDLNEKHITAQFFLWFCFVVDALLLFDCCRLFCLDVCSLILNFSFDWITTFAGWVSEKFQLFFFCFAVFEQRTTNTKDDNRKKGTQKQQIEGKSRKIPPKPHVSPEQTIVLCCSIRKFLDLSFVPHCARAILVFSRLLPWIYMQSIFSKTHTQRQTMRMMRMFCVRVWVWVRGLFAIIAPRERLQVKPTKQCHIRYAMRWQQ